MVNMADGTTIYLHTGLNSIIVSLFANQKVFPAAPINMQKLSLPDEGSTETPHLHGAI